MYSKSMDFDKYLPHIKLHIMKMLRGESNHSRLESQTPQAHVFMGHWPQFKVHACTGGQVGFVLWWDTLLWAISKVNSTNNTAATEAQFCPGSGNSSRNQYRHQNCTKQAPHHLINHPDHLHIAGLKAPVGRNPDFLVRRHPPLPYCPCTPQEGDCHLGSKPTVTGTLKFNWQHNI